MADSVESLQVWLSIQNHFQANIGRAQKKPFKGAEVNLAANQMSAGYPRKQAKSGDWTPAAETDRVLRSLPGRVQKVKKKILSESRPSLGLPRATKNSRLQFYQWLEILICCSQAEDKILVVKM